MPLGRTQAQASVDQASKAGEALDAIISAIASIHDLNTQIASAAEEQTAVSEEISRNVVEINQMAEHTADGANQTATAREQLANELQGLVKQFKV